MNSKGILAMEWMQLRRSRMRQIAVLAYLLLGAYAIFSGHQYIQKWEEAIVKVEAEEQENAEQALEWYAEGISGPEGSPWVDLKQPLWAAWYTGSYLCKSPAPLAVVSLGVSDTRPNYARITRFSSPFNTKNKPELINPEQLMAGHFDLAFVLVFLSPLLLLLLSFNILGYEQDEGLLPLIQLQVGSLSGWVGLRLGFQLMLAFTSTAALWLLAGIIAGNWGASLWLGLLLSGGYLLFWAGIVFLVLSLRKGLSFNALTLALLWMVISILLPATANLWSQTKYPHDYSTGITDAQRADTYALYDKEAKELEPQLFELYPEAKESAYVQDTVRDPLIDRHIFDAAELLLNEAAAAEAMATEAGREDLARASVWYNPAYAFQMGLDAISGNGSAAYQAYLYGIGDAVKTKVRKILEFALAKEPMSTETFQELRQTVGPNQDYAAPIPGMSWLVILLYAAIAGGVGMYRLQGR